MFFRCITGEDLVIPNALHLRSAMSRNALLCIGELVACLRDTVASSLVLRAVVPVLLQRATTDKQFIRNTAINVRLFSILNLPLIICSNRLCLKWLLLVIPWKLFPSFYQKLATKMFNLLRPPVSSPSAAFKSSPHCKCRLI